MDTLSASRPRVVFDLYKWLPPHGETAVSFHCEGLELVVEIAFDDEADGKPTLRKRVVRFTGLCAFYVVASPGVDLTRIKYWDPTASGAIVEYLDSEVARQWQELLTHRQRPIRHYQACFLSENRRLDVFAEDCLSS